jgi:hypothetical protein
MFRAAVVAAAVVAGASASPAVPPFTAHITPLAKKDLPFSYRSGCPVGPAHLRLVRLRYWGFDAGAHLGSIVVAADVTRDVVTVFARLYAARFPIRRMEPIDAFRGSDDRSMAADNTSGFNCRYAVAPGPKRWSAHAYGLAIDVNPVENPYVEGGVVRPPAGRRYLVRSKQRPGMAEPGGVIVKAFAGVGWKWGGRWASSPDYQHFSAGGR